jgi:hypothetical protein
VHNILTYLDMNIDMIFQLKGYPEYPLLVPAITQGGGNWKQLENIYTEAHEGNTKDLITNF